MPVVALEMGGHLGGLHAHDLEVDPARGAADRSYGVQVARLAGMPAALIRQARKDAPPVDKAAVSQGLAPRKGRAYRELFQLVREHLGGTGLEREEESNSDEDSDD